MLCWPPDLGLPAPVATDLSSQGHLGTVHPTSGWTNREGNGQTDRKLAASTWFYKKKQKKGSPESRATSPKVTLGSRNTQCPQMPSYGLRARTQGQWHSAPESTHTCGPHLEPQLGASRCRHHCHHRLLGHSVTLLSHVPAAASWQASPEPGDANLWQTSEEAISKTAITRKGNKLLLTSETFTHGESAPDKVIRAMCLQSCIIYIEIFHRERSAREIEG